MSSEETYEYTTGDGVTRRLSRERKLVVDYLRDQADRWDLEEPSIASRNISSALRVNAEKIARGWHDPDEPRPDPRSS